MTECWCCDNPTASHDDYIKYMQRTIKAHGRMVQAVEGTRVYAPFAYTVGLTCAGLPELVITGKRAALACSMLNAVAGYVSDGNVILPGEVMRLGDVHLEAVVVPQPEAHLISAVELYGSSARGLQMVWADGRERLPWEVGHRGGRGGQPVLGPRSRS